MQTQNSENIGSKQRLTCVIGSGYAFVELKTNHLQYCPRRFGTKLTNG
jgi:hypothetical protein